MYLNLLLLQFCRSVPPPVRLATTCALSTLMLSSLAVASSSRRESQSNFQSEPTDALRLALDWP